MTDTQQSLSSILLEGVRVHNLRNVSLQIQRNSLTVICGVSGSGKSSLAFDTLFAEGQRRYVETFSPYARQFLDRIERPDVDRIEGIPPAIAIRQNARTQSARSTVGTRTEIFDYLRVLFARAGTVVCPRCNVAAVSMTPDSAAEHLLTQAESRRAMLVFDAEAKAAALEDLRTSGFARCIVDGTTTSLDETLETPLNGDSSIQIVGDRVRIAQQSRVRLADSIEQIFATSNGRCVALVEAADVDTPTVEVDGKQWQSIPLSRELLCVSCGREFPLPSPEQLSFQSPLGACSTCDGTGHVTITPTTGGDVTRSPCPDCHGHRIGEMATLVQLNGWNVATAGERELEELRQWLVETVEMLSDEMTNVLSAPIRQLTNRIEFLTSCGLGYLSLARSMKTLSGGEAQRVVLTSALGSGLINTLYVLDEPTSGLHADDSARVIEATRRLQQPGNTVVVVEHDSDFINAADEVIEIGPGAGGAGGEIVFQGTPTELNRCTSTATGVSLSERQRNESVSAERRTPVHWLKFRGVNCHNVLDLSGQLPLEVICAVTGVSGSGKSSLVVDALYPELCRQLEQPCDSEAQSSVMELIGSEQISAVRLLDQSLLRGSRRSIPATTIGCFNDIRKVMAETHEARKRNYKPGMFSFNSSQGGRCPNCDGHGLVTVEMQFLADIQTTCEACSGKRFRPDLLEVRYRDRNIHDILQMTTDEGFTFFNGHRRIQQRLNALRQAGLGYIRLGQPVASLSGGESQRLRIAALLAGVELSDDSLPVSSRKPSSQRLQRTLFILDEPSTGLHMRDIASLMKCLNHLVEIGHSVVVIEHDPGVLRHADYAIELGPGPGRHGGRIVAAGETL